MSAQHTDVHGLPALPAADAYIQTTQRDPEKDGYDMDVDIWMLPPGRSIPADSEGVTHEPLFTSDKLRAYAHAAVESALRQSGEAVMRDREADRARFADKDFNDWLDCGISDSGHTVYDTINSVSDAWQGWHAHIVSMMCDSEPASIDLTKPATPSQSGEAVDLEQRARELLAAEYAREGFDQAASELRSSWYLPTAQGCIAIRAIAAALSQQSGTSGLVGALLVVRDVLAASPIDCLGGDEAADGMPYPIRDEVIDRISKALAAHDARGGR